MSDAGWIKLWRKLRDNPWLQDAIQRAIFVTILLDAEHEPAQRRVMDRIISLERGQAFVSLRSLAQELDVSKRRIERGTQNLEKGGLIVTQTGTRGTIATICNFEKYQSDGTQPVTQTGTRAVTQAVTTLRREEEKKERKNGGADAPEEDLDALLYRRGKELLGKSAGGQITKLKAAVGTAGALEAIEAAWRKQNPAEYVAGIIRHHAQPEKPVWRDPL